MSSKHAKDSFLQPDHNPEPSKYNPSDHFYSKRRRSANFGFGSATRFSPPSIYENKVENVIAIGPGSYAPDVK